MSLLSAGYQRGEWAVSYPPGSSRTQPVRLTVGAGPTTAVTPDDWTQDTNSIGYYTADADVTAELGGLPSGTPVTVTVGNVFAPTGTGCFGGWSLAVAFTTDTAGCSAERREIFVYEGHAGGVGITERGFACFADWAADTARLLARCPCRAGCPSCVQSPKCGNLNGFLDKAAGLGLLGRMTTAERGR